MESNPTIISPLQSARGFLGEIKIWRETTCTHLGGRTHAEYILPAREYRRWNVCDYLRLPHVPACLEESDRFKSSLLSSVSHELRTPLATIKAAVTSLRSGTVEWDTEARADLLAAVEEETDHLNQLVGNLLSMSRIEAGALKPQRSWNSLAEMVSERP